MASIPYTSIREVLRAPSMNTHRGSSPDLHHVAHMADHILAKTMLPDSSEPSKSDERHHDSDVPLYAPPSLPSVTRHMPCYAMRSAKRFRPATSCHDTPSALELRFVERHLGKYSGETDMSMIDVQKGFDVFNRGIDALPDSAVPWELETTERHAILLQALLLNDAKKYADSVAEASFFEKLLVKRSRNQLEDDADFGIAAYTHDFMEYTVADSQLEQLEGVADKRNLSLPFDDPAPEDRLKTCLDTILTDSTDGPMSQLAV
ncbi:uncharacterized protein F5891DRAFT_1191647 [Suillus fuscotomentosus]|uniref:Uncharacterized protein n=1 Tax=Suillus fuscotomentosus TaxID=1912939 RepID=A0AAD4E1W3_9AGAM|nr:uncharacterized protein F5891DRAFT_1191647 [Suillus fuscotomentosus]KAG1897721.1 hypothetical protein F5891DRAFT_1191647 [Suillus fuscotomentosus]